jgi:hypothetical protein
MPEKATVEEPKSFGVANDLDVEHVPPVPNSLEKVKAVDVFAHGAALAGLAPIVPGAATTFEEQLQASEQLMREMQQDLSQLGSRTAVSASGSFSDADLERFVRETHSLLVDEGLLRSGDLQVCAPAFVDLEQLDSQLAQLSVDLETSAQLLL